MPVQLTDVGYRFGSAVPRSEKKRKTWSVTDLKYL